MKNNFVFLRTLWQVEAKDKDLGNFIGEQLASMDNDSALKIQNDFFERHKFIKRCRSLWLKH